MLRPYRDCTRHRERIVENIIDFQSSYKILFAVHLKSRPMADVQLMHNYLVHAMPWQCILLSVFPTTSVFDRIKKSCCGHCLLALMSIHVF